MHNPESEWKIFDNTHEAIWTEAIADAARLARQTRRRPTKMGEMGMFSGMMFCADCGSIIGQNTRDENCVFIPFCHDKLVIATPVTDHYLALKDRETPTIFHDFLKDSIILREKGSGTKKEMDLFLERTGITTGNLNVIARMNDLESIKKSIVNGLGISILSSRSVNDLQRTKQILVFRLEEAAHKRSFYIVYSKKSILKPHVKQFVQFARDYYM